MNIKELRIGNLIESIHGDNVTYTEVDLPLFAALESDQISEDDISPIPLNEIWLKRAGFRPSVEEIPWIELGEATSLEIMEVQGFWYPTLEQEAEYHHDYVQRVSLNCIQYVHQLQNLYFVLTGTELEFTE